MSPTDAALETLRRVVAATEPRLLDDQGRPTFGLSFYAVNKRGEFGGASIWSGTSSGAIRQYAAYDGRDAALHDSAYLFERSR
jgi:N4-(beta-N-acetylglucosaminyl)-L-asparaginase